MKITALTTYPVAPRRLFLEVETDEGVTGWGFTAVKMNAGGRMRLLESQCQIDAPVARVAAVREVIGPDRDVVVDFHGRVSPAVARELCRALEPLQPMFAEQPVLSELSHRLREICAGTTMPIAAGERLYSRWDVDEFLRSGIAVAQPYLSHAGGISECRRIAATAEKAVARAAELGHRWRPPVWRHPDGSLAEW